MHHSHDVLDEEMGLSSFTHPRYFYGQRLDVRHFESEQEYFKGKLRLLNRMVIGYGVVCGLNVEVADDRKSVVVTSGLAIDKLGREIVVPSRSVKIPIPSLDPQSEPLPPQEGRDCDDPEWVQILICFRSCSTDPEPVFAGGCDVVERCSAGAIRERYEIPPPREGKAHPIGIDCIIPDLVKGNRINYAALASWVTKPCDMPPEDPCIPLANVRRRKGDRELLSTDIDISVRPVVYTLDLLFQIILCTLGDNGVRRGGKY
jgi:hypothetical protein